MNRTKMILIILLVTAVAAFFLLGFDRFLSIELVKSGQQFFRDYYRTHPFRTMAAYSVFYIFIVMVSIPGTAVLAIAGGTLFGLLNGVILASFSSTVGALFAFFMSRYLFQDWIRSHFGKRLSVIDAGMEKSGVFYLFMLRLVPVFPFFLINLMMGLTRLRPWTYYWISQVGMLPATIVYVNAGTQLSKVDSVEDILSFELVGSLLILALFPLATRKMVRLIRGIYRQH